MKEASLRAWLRREPAPSKVKVTLDNGEERDIVIPADLRNRWKTVEASIRAQGAVAVTLLNKTGDVLRAQPLEPEGGEEEDESPEAKAEARQDARNAKNMKELASVLDAQAQALNVAFTKGKEAAAQSQESLVDLVDTMASHFATALTNIHNIVGNMAVMMQTNAENTAKLTQKIADLSSGHDGSSDTVGQALGGLLMAAAQQKAAPAPSPPAAHPPNGSKKGA
jgi:hypothetical protein